MDAAAERGATRLGLLCEPRAHAAHPLPDHVLRAFAGTGGGGVLLCAVRPDGVVPYRSRSRHVRLEGRRGRTASYEFTELGPMPDSLPEPDLAAHRSRLDAALRDIEGFAREIDQPHWADRFREARDAMDAGTASPWIESLFGDGLLEGEAFGLLAASFKADVFGGMGSWNDIPTDETIGPRYRELSDALSRSLRPSFVAAVNSRTGST
jgi:hypothetical protein